MNLKSLFIISFVLSILIFPCVSGNLNFLGKSQVINNESPLSNDDRIWVDFCYGKISGLYDFGSGYNHYIAKGFIAEDVICIINYTDRPLYHHLTGVPCAIIQAYGGLFHRLIGTVSDDFICASYGFIPPKILLLIYFIQDHTKINCQF